jgi:regulator of sigma D
VDGDPEANLLHFAIQKLHWSPSQINEWLDADQSVKALYYASVTIKAAHDKEEAARIKAKSKDGKRKR